MILDDSKHPQRKRKTFKQPKPLKVKEKKERVLKKPLRCGHKYKTICEKHDLPCHIEIDWPIGDSRIEYKKKLTDLGAPEHTKDSDHRCKLCFKERFENSPYQEMEVEGLNALTLARMKRDQNTNAHSMTVKNNPTPLKPPNDTD